MKLGPGCGESNENRNENQNENENENLGRNCLTIDNRVFNIWLFSSSNGRKSAVGIAMKRLASSVGIHINPIQLSPE